MPQPKVRSAFSVMRVALFALSVGYPLLVFFSAQRIDPALIVLVLVTLAVIRQLMGGIEARSVAMLVLLCAYAAWTLIADNPRSALYYPVIMNLAMLWMFARSLSAPQTIIERMARARDANISEHASPYLRKLTFIWCAMFVFNGVAAFITATWMSTKVWMIYNGLIAYLLIGALIVGELLYRPIYKRRFENPGESS